MKQMALFAGLFCIVAVAATFALSPSSMDTLLAESRSPEVAMRRAAVVALGKRSEDADRAIPALEQRLEDENFAIRVLAGMSLIKLGVVDGEVPILPTDGPALLEALTDPNTEVRDSAREGLGQVGQFIVPELVAELDHPDTSVHFAVLSVLGNLGPRAAEAAPALAAYITHQENDGCRLSAINALGRIGPQAQVAVPALIEILETGDQFDRRHAANTLAEIGPAAAPATPVLEAALDDNDFTVRSNAQKALMAIRRRG